jgi:hypothetical protein
MMVCTDEDCTGAPTCRSQSDILCVLESTNYDTIIEWHLDLSTLNQPVVCSSSRVFKVLKRVFA